MIHGGHGRIRDNLKNIKAHDPQAAAKIHERYRMRGKINMIRVNTGNIGDKVNKLGQHGDGNAYQYNYQVDMVFVPPLPKLKNNENCCQEKAKYGEHGNQGKKGPCCVPEIMDIVYIKPKIFIDQVVDIGSPHEKGKKTCQ
jgi:hypothetical protein